MGLCQSSGKGPSLAQPLLALGSPPPQEEHTLITNELAFVGLITSISLEKEMTSRSSTLAWEIPWTEDPGGLQSMGVQSVGQNRATEHSALRSIKLSWI